MPDPRPSALAADWEVGSHGATQRLATWIAETPSSWPDEISRRARDAFIDTAACILAGAHDPAARNAHTAVRAWGAGEAATAGASGRLAAPWAALVNGTAAHALDYDDVLEVANAHVSAVLVPAILALGEERDASGAQCLDAFIVGVEVMARLGEAVNMSHYFRGWHTTLTLGTPAAAAAAARLLGLDADRSLAAISIATSMAGGFKRQFGTMTKPIHAGLAAKNGIMAACLAEAGVTGAADAYEGARGFIDLFAGTPAERLDDALDRLGAPPAIVQHGLWQKVYPCCASAHRPLDALLALHAEESVRPDAVTAIEARISEVAAQNLTYPAPSDAMQARFSLHYLLASALVDGRLGLDAFETAALSRAEVRALLPRITMQADPAQPGTANLDERAHAAEVTVYLTGGGKLTRAVIDPKGHPGQPISEAALVAKFEACATRVLPSLAIEPALAALMGLAEHGAVRQVTRHWEIVDGC